MGEVHCLCVVAKEEIEQYGRLTGAGVGGKGAALFVNVVVDGILYLGATAASVVHPLSLQ